EHAAKVDRVAGRKRFVRDQVLDRLPQREAVIAQIHLVGVVLLEVDAGRGHVDLAGRARGAVEVQAGGAGVAPLRQEVELDGDAGVDGGPPVARAVAERGTPAAQRAHAPGVGLENKGEAVGGTGYRTDVRDKRGGERARDRHLLPLEDATRFARAA